MKFPDKFLWGSATSAYQVEGGIENSDWSGAGKACDHYARFQEDFDLLQKLNQNSHRFSIEWSRIEPEQGIFSEKEIEHYKKVLEGLKSRGIKAMVTLHHFTLPSWLSKVRGFSNKKSVFYFTRFSEKLFSEYQDLVDYWVTINEPLVFSSKGYIEGAWPPKKKNIFLFFEALTNQIQSHQIVYKNFHKKKNDVQVGIAKNNIYFEPLNKNFNLDQVSAFFAKKFWNEYFLNHIQDQSDFIGLNYYFHNRIQFPWKIKNENKVVSDIGWEVYPEGIYRVLKDLKKYNLPVYITENGIADKKDGLREDFIKDHLYWIQRAIKDKIDVRGYFHWSLIDNFEWEKGFGPKFGLIEVDEKTFERRIRQSAFSYAKICKDNSLE